MNGRLEGRVALVTGAAQGIGEAIVRGFIREGALVAAIDIKEEKVRALCRDLGPAATPFGFDITDSEAYRRCVDETDRLHGRIDVLVNNAAIATYDDILHDKLENWRRTQAVNLEAVYWGSKLVAPIMARRQWGRIVSIASIQALGTDGRLGAYCASKGGIVSLTHSMAVELAPHGILVNAIAPGCIHTPMSIIDGVDETTTEIFKTWYVGFRKIPLARPGEPSEIASAAIFLASEECSYITGHTMVVDGGMSITF